MSPLNGFMVRSGDVDCSSSEELDDVSVPVDDELLSVDDELLSLDDEPLSLTSSFIPLSM